MAQTHAACTILARRIGADAARRQRIAEETLKAQMAQMSYEARTAAGLTQQALAARWRFVWSPYQSTGSPCDPFPRPPRRAPGTPHAGGQALL